MEKLRATANSKEQLYILSVNEHIYEAAKEYVDNCVKIAREAIKPISKMAIIAIRKEHNVVMLKETYFNKRKYYSAIKGYTDKGFNVVLVDDGLTDMEGSKKA